MTTISQVNPAASCFEQPARVPIWLVDYACGWAARDALVHVMTLP